MVGAVPKLAKSRPKLDQRQPKLGQISRQLWSTADEVCPESAEIRQHLVGSGKHWANSVDRCPRSAKIGAKLAPEFCRIRPQLAGLGVGRTRRRVRSQLGPNRSPSLARYVDRYGTDFDRGQSRPGIGRCLCPRSPEDCPSSANLRAVARVNFGHPARRNERFTSERLLGNVPSAFWGNFEMSALPGIHPGNTQEKKIQGGHGNAPQRTTRSGPCERTGEDLGRRRLEDQQSKQGGNAPFCLGKA